MTRAPLGDKGDAARLDQALREWVAAEQTNVVVGALEHQPAPDDRGHYHWLLRLRGEERPVITVWFSLRQRTVHVETELMPAPDTRREELFHYLLVKNHELRELHLAIGPEDGVYLVAQVPTGEMTLERLDELVGATLHYVDELFPTAMAMGLPSLFRRRGAR